MQFGACLPICRCKKPKKCENFTKNIYDFNLFWWWKPGRFIKNIFYILLNDESLKHNEIWHLSLFWGNQIYLLRSTFFENWNSTSVLSRPQAHFNSFLSCPTLQLHHQRVWIKIPVETVFQALLPVGCWQHISGQHWVFIPLWAGNETAVESLNDCILSSYLI